MAGPYTIVTAVGGQPASASLFGNAVKAAIDDLHNRVATLEGFTTGKPVGKAVQSSSQALADATFVAVQLQTEEFDSHGFHDNVTNNTRITPSVPGIYRFTGTVVWEAQTTPVGVDAHFRKNGSASIIPGVRIPGSTTITAQQVTVTIPFNGTTDYVELMARQDSAGSDNTQVNAPFACTVEWSFERILIV